MPAESLFYDRSSDVYRILTFLRLVLFESPRAYTNVHPIKDGKTARQLLLEQLDILDNEMKEIVQDIYMSDSQRMMAHARFLQDKFGKSSMLIGGME